MLLKMAKDKETITATSEDARLGDLGYEQGVQSVCLHMLAGQY